METDKLKQLYDDFSREFNEETYKNVMANWEYYRREIKSGVNSAFDVWVQKTKETKKGNEIPHDPLANFLIYDNSGAKFIANPGNIFPRHLQVIFDVEKNMYKIFNPTEQLVGKDEAINEFESVLYKHFKDLIDFENVDSITDPPYLYIRLMIILESMRTESKYYNSLVWAVQDEAINDLAKIFDINGSVKKSSFFKLSNEVYVKAAEILLGKKNEQARKDMEPKEIFKLNKFLWDIQTEKNLIIGLNKFSNTNIILHGAPGTGKTYTVDYEIKKLQLNDPEKYCLSKFIQFHPSYTYQDFIEGIKPMGIKDGNLDLQVVNGSFKDFCIKVRHENEEYYKKTYTTNSEPDPKDPDQFKDWPHHYFVVDEINRGDLSNIFGETFTLLEYRDYDFSGDYSNVKKGANLTETTMSAVIKKMITDPQNTAQLTEQLTEELVYKQIENGDVVFGIPFNIHFVGMMNDVDRSIDSFDLALRRRFKWKELFCDTTIVSINLIEKGFIEYYVKLYKEYCDKLNKYISDTLKLGKSYEIGHAFFLKMTSVADVKKRVITSDNLKDLFDDYISGTLKEYCRMVSSSELETDQQLKDARKIFIEPNFDKEKLKRELANKDKKKYTNERITEYLKKCKALNTKVMNEITEGLELLPCDSFIPDDEDVLSPDGRAKLFENKIKQRLTDLIPKAEKEKEERSLLEDAKTKFVGTDDSSNNVEGDGLWHQEHHR